MEKIKLCECGCGEPAPIAVYTNKRLGYKKGHPVRFILGHWVRAKKANFKDRFASNNANWKGGISKTKLYYTWSNMMNRCYNTNSSSYADYGGRGIGVCQKWQSAKDFIKWGLTNGWNENDALEIDRTNNNKGYSPINCRFVDRKTNARNTRSSKTWHVKDKFYPSLRTAAKAENVSTHTILAWCDGGVQHGVYYSPKPNCWSEKLYKQHKGVA